MREVADPRKFNFKGMAFKVFKLIQFDVTVHVCIAVYIDRVRICQFETPDGVQGLYKNQSPMSQWPGRSPAWLGYTLSQSIIVVPDWYRIL